MNSGSRSLVNRKGLAIKPSETLVVKARAAELAKTGRRIIDLSTGEPDIDTPEYIKEAARQAIAAGKTRYTAAAGTIELREALSAKLKNENGLDYKPSDIVVSNGGKQALYTVFDVTLEPGDEVIVPAPYWVSYPAMIEMAGGTPVYLHGMPENGFKITPEQLQKAITPRTKWVLMNSPCNPTGLCYSESEQRALGQVVAKSSALVLSDEIYEKIVYDGFKFVSFEKACPEMAGRVVTVNGFAKSFSMTGWRIGYAAGPQEIIAAVIRHQSQATSSINSISQSAALAALTGDQSFMAPMVKSFKRRFDDAFAVLKDAPGITIDCVPQGAFYLFMRFAELKKMRPNHPALQSSIAFTNHLLDTQGLAAVMGVAFGDDQAFRISVAAADEQVAAGVRAVKAVAEEIAG